LDHLGQSQDNSLCDELRRRPAEAIDVLIRSGADWLAIGPFLVEGVHQNVNRSTPEVQPLAATG